MALPILIAIVSAPALLGTQEAIRQSQSKEKREEHRARRCNLIASCVKSSKRSREINGRPVVLRDGKLWIDTGTSDGTAFGHPYTGYYLPYPDEKYEGLVTTITEVAPIMNWVFVDRETYEVKYGVRLDAQPNLTGPFDCTRQDRRLTFDSWEGWCAVEEQPSMWALYFDRDDDGLAAKLAPGTRVLEIELTRKEKRWKKDGEERQKDQTTKRAVDAKEDAPVDNPVTGQQEDIQAPGVGVPQENGEAEEQERKPFRLPKSIFSDPPRPLFWGQEMEARSPPPAYYAEPVGHQNTQVDDIVLPPPAQTPAPAPSATTKREPGSPMSPQKAMADFMRAITPQPRTPRSEGRMSPEKAMAEFKRAITTQPPSPGPKKPIPVEAAMAELRRAQTPPPAPDPGEPVPVAKTMAGLRRAETPPPAPGSSSPDSTVLGEAFETPRRVSPPAGDKSSLAPAPLKLNTSPDRRPAPKLNRNSGSRTMSQAQMFESMATKQTISNDITIKKPESRRVSNATSRSDYSTDRIDEEEIFDMYGRPESSVLSAAAPAGAQAQAGAAPPAASDPAVFARLSSGSSTASDPAVVKDKSNGTQPIRGKISTTASSANTAPKESQSSTPGVFSAASSSRSTPLGRRPTATSERTRAVSPEKQSRPSLSASKESPRTATRNPIRPLASRESPAPRRANTSSSSQPQRPTSRDSPSTRRQPPSRDSPARPPSRDSPVARRAPLLARTNTAPSRDGVRRMRTTTTSGLYREIDDMVGAGRNRSASGSSARSADVRGGGGAREPVLRRAATSRDLRGERTRGVGRRGEKERERERDEERGL